jgi:transglutaminase-like putative cysteine protease
LAFALLWSPVILGLTLGWLLAASRASGRLSAVLSLLIGPLLVMVQIGNLGDSLASLAVSPFILARQAAITGVMPSTAFILNDLNELTLAIRVLVARLADWFAALAQGQPAFDPVATAVLWELALWGMAVWAAWFLRRRKQPVLGLLPALMLLATMLNISGGSAFYLATALALTLILEAATSYRQWEQSWKADDIGYLPRFGWASSGLALGLVVLALLTPSLSIYRLVDLARSLSPSGRQGEVARSLGLEAAAKEAGADVFAQERHGGMPARHLIGSGPELSEEQVMTISIEQSPALASQLRYWRGITYDTYTGSGWETRGTKTINYMAGETAGGDLENRRLVRQEVRPLTALDGPLYAAGSLVTVDQDFQAAWRARYRGTETYFDLFAASLEDGGKRPYRADSLIPVYDEEALRAAGQDYPDWLAGRYLSLPDDLSGRVLGLARDLTATEPTPYDRARAIERHLRGYPYTLDLPAPPANREIADYFLFELQRGYCDYYATSMVVLARAAGLPARLATGFVGGTVDEENNQTIVTADLAHSWPEVYFPDYGWISFEPTAGRAAIERPTEAQPLADPEPETELEPITAARGRARWNLVLHAAAGLLLTAVGLFLGWWLLDTWRLRHLAPGQAIIHLFERLNRSGRRLKVPPEPGETPHEYAGRLSAHILNLSSARRGASLLASAPDAINWLTRLYTRTLFSPRPPKAKQHTRAIQTWSRLRFQLLWAAVLLRLEKLFRNQT